MDVPQWDFDWQFFYEYEKPIQVGISDELVVTCTYDTRGATSDVYFGGGTEDEMCLVGIYVTAN